MSYWLMNISAAIVVSFGTTQMACGSVWLGFLIVFIGGLVIAHIGTIADEGAK